MLCDRLILEPNLSRCLEQAVRTDDIRLDERIGSVNRAIHVGFGCEVHDRIDPFLPQQLLDQRAVPDVSLHEPQRGVGAHGLKICQIARVGQRVQNHQTVLRVT